MSAKNGPNHIYSLLHPVDMNIFYKKKNENENIQIIIYRYFFNLKKLMMDQYFLYVDFTFFSIFICISNQIWTKFD